MNGVPTFTEGNNTYYLDMSGPYRNNSGIKERVKLDDFSGKMRPFQSFYAASAMLSQGIIKNTYKFGCESKNHASYYYKSGDNTDICLITEGEKKSSMQISDSIFQYGRFQV